VKEVLSFGLSISACKIPLSILPCPEYIDLINLNFPPFMNRRETIKAMMASSGALIALPSWAEAWNAGDVAVHRSSFSMQTQETLAAVSDTIIPAGNSIGALSVGVDKFLQKLIDNCYEKEVQDNIKTQLASLEASAQSLHGKPFKECDQAQREGLLLRFAGSENAAETEFFKLIKSETIRGFNTSRDVMVNYLKFKQVPGHYYGCVDVTT
jgi:hypothetical protein